MISNNDPYDLSRFLRAQETIYESVLAELGNGRKQSHWMWFIFPQIEGLGYSSTSKYYSIKSMEEAREYLKHPLLGPRLLKCAETVLAIKGKNALEIFGSPDDMKLGSSMTLFACATESETVFVRVLEKYFDGKPDKKTQILLGCIKK
ncbi:MAG: DUF1810 domain-containing protein [Anaerolineales bacterium]|jgi:uncharacterized protein (DUF1810 family)